MLCTINTKLVTNVGLLYWWDPGARIDGPFGPACHVPGDNDILCTASIVGGRTDGINSNAIGFIAYELAWDAV